MHCSALQCVVIFYSVLHCLQCCECVHVLQHLTVCGSVLQRVATCCSHVSVCLCAAAPYSVLQCFIVCCSVGSVSHLRCSAV